MPLAGLDRQEKVALGVRSAKANVAVLVGGRDAERLSGLAENSDLAFSDGTFFRKVTIRADLVAFAPAKNINAMSQQLLGTKDD